MRQIYKKAYTVVEIVVVISILTVLAAIWYVSYSKFIGDSKDVIRITDVTNMNQVLEISFIQNAWLPIPDEWTQITHEWDVVWTQGVFWTGARIFVQNLDEIPRDPDTWDFYSYSLLRNKKEYEIVTVFEWDIIWYSPSIIPNTYASEKKAYTLWTFNKRIVAIRKWKNTTVLALPSITTSNFLDSEVWKIVENGNLVIHNASNLPAQNNGTSQPQNWNTKNVISQLVIYDGTTQSLWENDSKISLIKNMQNTYSQSSILKNDSVYESLMKVDSSNSMKVQQYIEKLSEKQVWWIPLIR